MRRLTAVLVSTALLAGCAAEERPSGARPQAASEPPPLTILDSTPAPGGGGGSAPGGGASAPPAPPGQGGEGHQSVSRAAHPEGDRVACEHWLPGGAPEHEFDLVPCQHR